MKLRIFAVMTLLALFLTACGGNTDSPAPSADPTVQTEATEAAAPEGSVTLTKAGTVNPDDFSYRYSSFFVRKTADRIKLLDLNAQTESTSTYLDVKSYIRDGICVVEGDNSLLGIADAYSDKELAACSATDVWKLNDRFILLSYGAPALDLGNVGYGKVLDLEKGEFVPGLEIKVSAISVSATNDVIVVKQDATACNAYSPDGTLIGNYENLNCYPKANLLFQLIDSKTVVYDSKLNKVSELPGYRFKSVDGFSNMLIQQVDGGYQVTDLQGNAISPVFDQISYVITENLLQIYEEETKLHKIVTLEGTEVLSVENGVIHYREPGYFVTLANNIYNIYTIEGTQINKQPLVSDFGGVCLTSDAGYKNLLDLSTGETIAIQEYPNYLINSLISVDSKVYNVITGETLFENVRSCFACGDSIYVMLDGEEVYTRYIVEY